MITLNTDDPVISGIDLRHEFAVAAPAAGLTAGEIRQAQLNALEIAFLSASEKAALITAKTDRPLNAAPFFQAVADEAAKENLTLTVSAMFFLLRD